MIRILVGGDICPMGRVQSAFIAGRASDIFHDLLPEIQSADLSVTNLECPLVSRPSPIAKSGPILGAPPDCIRGLVDSHWDVLNLANNHSYDHGVAGLYETLATIRGAGLAAIGVGASLTEAQAPIVRQINGQRIVLYSMAEREFSVADDTTPGANPCDVINFVHAVRQHKQNGIFVTLIHGGKEFYPYPSPDMVRRCRFMVEMGADAVICCHTHCPLPWEIHENRPIIYGLGNLVFEPSEPMLESWHEGYLARLDIDGNHVRFQPVPYFQSRDVIGAKAMTANDRSRFHREFEIRNARIKDLEFVRTQWQQYCVQRKADYFAGLFAYGTAMWKLRRVILPLVHSRQSILRALLLVQCETHREVLTTILKVERLRGS